MERVTFLLSKDPTTEHGGDIALSRILLGIASEHYDVEAVCLSGETGPAEDRSVTRVPKPPVSARSLLARSARRMQSLCHVRYDVEALVSEINSRESDVFIAEHSYMAESFLRSRHAGKTPFVVNTVNTESEVWKATRGWIGRVEAPRILRDEVRVARAADAVGTYDREEAEFYRDRGVRMARWIDLTLPPAPRLDLTSTARRLVFMGTRDWPPNQEAFLTALRLWPRISEGISDAELCIIGAKKPGAADPEYPDGVRDLGFVDDLQEFLGTCRALIAPVSTGGGVRVKILEAAAKGLPVVGTSAAIGSLGPVLGLDPCDSDDEFIAECRRFLLETDYSTKNGSELYERNASRWDAGVPQESVLGLIARSPVPAGR